MTMFDRIHLALLDLGIAGRIVTVDVLALLDASLRPLLVAIAIAALLVGIAVARDILTTDYPEPED